MFHDSTITQFYDQRRRRRRWSIRDRNSFEGYAAYLAGDVDEIAPIIGAGTAAIESDTGSPASRAIFIGVATSVLAFLVNRWLGKVLE